MLIYCVCDAKVIQAIGINGVYLEKHICAAKMYQPIIMISKIYYKTNRSVGFE